MMNENYFQYGSMSYFVDLSAFNPKEPWILALHHAADRNDTEMLKVILNQEEEKNKGRLNRSEWKKEDASGAPLHHAAKHGHDEVIKLLVQAGADINSYEVDEHGNKWTALHDAVLARHADSVRTLIYMGAKLNVEGHHSKKCVKGTPLDWAVLSGISSRSDIVHMLEHFENKEG